MKKLKVVLSVIAYCIIVQSARAAYVGKLDLVSNPNFEAIALRDAQDGLWLVGAQKQIWSLQNTTTNKEVFHVSGFWATRLQGQETAYGPSIGIPIGTVAQTIAKAFGAASVMLPEAGPAADGSMWAVPDWIKKLGSFMSIDVCGGYRPTVDAGSGDAHWIYGFGGKINVPVDDIYSFFSSAPASPRVTQ